jgi:hypothetical protein
VSGFHSPIFHRALGEGFQALRAAANEMSRVTTKLLVPCALSGLLMISPGSEFLLWPELCSDCGALPTKNPPGVVKIKYRPKPASKQRFVASHYREEDFKGGLRRYAKYRDLGMAAASDKRQWGTESAKAGSARDSTVAAGCRLGSVIAVLAPKRAR